MSEHQSISPNTGRPFAVWGEMDEAELSARLDRLDRATEALQDDLVLRRDVLSRCLAALHAANEELQALTVTEVGKTPGEAAAELPYAASFLEAARGLVDDYAFTTATGDGRWVREVPRGLGLLIAPYNDPVAGLTRKLAPCLAAGAGAILKPSGLGVQCALALARALSAEGLDDVVLVLPTARHDLIGRLIAEDRIGTVSFTGSTHVGLRLAVQAAEHAKGFVGELGGTNPFVVLADADVDKAVADLVSRKLRAAGQACSAQNIVHVERRLFDEVVTRVAEAFAAVAHGPSDMSGVTMGPVRTAGAVDTLARAAGRLEAENGQLVAGGITQGSAGSAFLAAPTLFRVREAGLLAQEEIFGPLLGIAPFDNLEVLRKTLSRNRQPLALYVYGRDDARIEHLVSGLRYGSIGVNTTAIQGAHVPTGGFLHAGIGREGGRWGLSEFLTTINHRNERG
jgi:succinate-semialdehyde dehydrogenase/glutarate-semialdehyde dehydrogenase